MINTSEQLKNIKVSGQDIGTGRFALNMMAMMMMMQDNSLRITNKY